ncbi:hypothetical protein ASJ78_00472 [Serratia marcescens]|nr:hypothetical protein ASJ78_00472 [Serratia marcescens]
MIMNKKIKGDKYFKNRKKLKNDLVKGNEEESIPKTLFISDDDFAVQKSNNAEIDKEITNFTIPKLHNVLKKDNLSIEIPNHSIEKIIEKIKKVNFHFVNQSSGAVLEILNMKQSKDKDPNIINVFGTSFSFPIFSNSSFFNFFKIASVRMLNLFLLLFIFNIILLKLNLDNIITIEISAYFLWQ